MLQWRKFQFFRKEVVKDPQTKKPLPSIEDLPITCCSSGRGHLIFGDAEGSIHLFDRNFRQNPFPAYEHRVTHLQQTRLADVLVSVGDDGGDDVHRSVIKVWGISSSQQQQQQQPTCLRSIKVFSSSNTNNSSTLAGLGMGGSSQRVSRPGETTAFALDEEELSVAALGMSSGDVVLIRGDLRRARHQVSLVPTGLGRPVTGLGVRRVASGRWCVFVVTTETVVAVHVDSRGAVSVEDLSPHQHIGASAGCAVMVDESPGLGGGSLHGGEMVLARKEGIYFYNPETLGAMIPFDFYNPDGSRAAGDSLEGEKVLLASFRSYLVVVSRSGQRYTTTIYDRKNKLNVFQGEMGEVRHVLQEWGSVFVVLGTPDGRQQLMQLEEENTEAKLDKLFRKHLYDIAIDLAHAQQFDETAITDIYRRYGDHLYTKGDYDRAVLQYEHTIGRLEPSYVIRKFLDAQRIHNLIRYLEALHACGRADDDHTTLLLNCYIKDRAEDKLDQFVTTTTGNTLHYDEETAIRVLRSAGYQRHALALAGKHSRHDWLLRILIEDAQEHRTALSHLATLPFSEARSYLARYAKVLVTAAPEQAVNLLVRLCTGYRPIPAEKDPSSHLMGYRSREHDHGGDDNGDGDRSTGGLLRGGSKLLALWNQGAAAAAATAATTTTTASSEDHSNDNNEGDIDKERRHDDGMHTAAGSGSSTPTSTSAPVSDARSALLGGGDAHSQAATTPPTADPYFLNTDNNFNDYNDNNMAATADAGDGGTEAASPEDFIHAFVDQQPWLRVFLERVTAERGASCPPVVFNTLLELYLRPIAGDNYNTDGNDDDDDDNINNVNNNNNNNNNNQEQEQDEDVIRELRMRALRLLEQEDGRYDERHALVLAQQASFQEGILYLYEKLGLYHDIVQYYMQKGDHAMVIEACRKYGDKHKHKQNLWVQVLSYFAQRQDADTYIERVLADIEREDLLPPLLVVQILGQNGRSVLGSIKEYLQRRLHQEQELMRKDEEEIEHYQRETTAMREEINKLRQQATVVKVTKCVTCSGTLDLPAVHYMCGHSFHQRCLGDAEDCPVCAPTNKTVLSRKQKYEESAKDHDLFEKLLSSNRFSTIADYFGRGIFNQDAAVEVAQWEAAEEAMDERETLLERY